MLWRVYIFPFACVMLYIMFTVSHTNIYCKVKQLLSPRLNYKVSRPWLIMQQLRGTDRELGLRGTDGSRCSGAANLLNESTWGRASEHELGAGLGLRYYLTVNSSWYTTTEQPATILDTRQVHMWHGVQHWQSTHLSENVFKPCINIKQWKRPYSEARRMNRMWH